METRSRLRQPRGGSSPRRPRALSLYLTLLVLAPLAAYGLAVVNATYGIRLGNALERNESTARLIARLLDEQCETALSALNILARRPSLAAAFTSGDAAAVGRYIREGVEAVPDLLFVAAYRSDGSLMSQYPATTPPSAPTADWLRRTAPAGVTVIGNVDRPPVGGAAAAPPSVVAALAVPLGPTRRPSGYLLAHYRLRKTDAWLRQIHIPGGSVYVCDAAGEQITASGAAPPARRSFAGYPPFLEARKSRGASGLRAPAVADGRDRESLVGYAYAALPDWVVLVEQPVRAAAVSVDYLVWNLALLAIPFFALVVAAAWNVARLYRRQEEMAGQLERQNDLLQAADRMKSDFLANVSHDLRTPLTSLQIAVSGLLDPEVEWTREQTREQLEMAGDELDRVSARVRNLLDMARLEAKAYTLHPQPCDVADLLRGVLERLEPVLRGRVLRAEYPREPLLVSCDTGQLETVFSNLLENAAKYSPPGSPVHVRGERRHGQVVVTVRDFGPGVPPGEEERVFEKFYRSPAQASAKGTGLGLAICRSIVTAHGGTIGVRNAPGRGAEFWVSLEAVPLPAERGRPVDGKGGDGEDAGSKE